MKHFFLLAILFSGIFTGFSQEDEDEKLSFEDSVKVTKFLQQVHRIELCELGLTCYEDSVYDNELNGKKPVKKCYLIGAIRNNSIDHSKITKKKELKPTKLVKFLLGTLKKQNRAITLCYSPRNAILFYNEMGEVISYLEICFECDHIRWWNNFGLIGFTSDQYDKLESYFSKNGLKTD